jgi:hypothetical protein
MLIIKLRQQTLILEKSWMRKHEVNYHEKTNIIEFFSEFCTHSRKIETKITSSSNKEKNFSFEKKSFLNQSDHSKFDDSIKNSRKLTTIVIKVLVKVNPWGHLWGGKSLIISNESRTAYKSSVHSSTKAMTTDYEYERSSSYREKWWYRDIIMMLSWHMFFFERTNHVLVIFFFLMIVVCWWCEDCLKYWTMRIERMQRSLIFRWIQKIRRFWSWVS